MQILGVDIGGSGIKGAIVDTDNGELITERHRIATPQPATPEAVAETLKQLVCHFEWNQTVGCGFPAVVQHGIAKTASNIAQSFIETAIDPLFSETTGCTCYSVNDADAAGLAEMQFGAGATQQGVVLMITIGTGLGTAVFIDGKLVPNTELGHLFLESGIEAERYTSDAVRKNQDLGWKVWGKRFNQYVTTLESLFWPDLIILGGGASKKLDKFNHLLSTKSPVKAATFLNQAGIVGAALYAETQMRNR
jgi:polyphosphate glucokinase